MGRIDEILNNHANRARFLAILFFIAFLIIPARIIHLHYFLDSSSTPGLSSSGARADSARHNLLDRNGNIIASNFTRYNFYLNPKKTIYPDLTVRSVSRHFRDISKKKLNRLSSRLKTRKNQWILVKRNISKELKTQLIGDGIEGAFFEETKHRIYPYKNLFSHVVGHVNYEGYGVSGIESFLNQELTHRNVELSLDARVQNVLRVLLQEALDTYKPNGLFGIVSDVQTGEILAMVSLPDYNPNNIKSGHDGMLNRVASAVYDLGSVFKVFSIAFGLDEGVRPTARFDTSQSISLPGFTISDEHSRLKYMNVREIFAHSSNVGVALVVKKAGLDKERGFYDKISLFDFEKYAEGSVGLGLPSAEIAKPLFPKGKWSDTLHYTSAYGYGVSISPLHFHQIASSIINHGNYTNLTLIKPDPSRVQGRKLEKVFHWVGLGSHQSYVTRIVSEGTSSEIRRMMLDVTKSGTAKIRSHNAYEICGKTGTSEKYDFQKKLWDGHRKLASFYAVFPCSDPKYAVYIGVDEPKVGKFPLQGGTVAAPIARRLIESIGPILNIPPAKREEE